MSRSSSFWHKQGQYVLENQNHALIIAAILAVIPFVAWLSLTVVALVTLRKGSYEGAKVLLASLLASIFLSYLVDFPVDLLYETIILFLTGFAAAQLLKLTASWQIVSTVLLILSLIAVGVLYFGFPDYVNQQYQAMLTLFKAYDFANIVDQIVEGPNGFSQQSLAGYLLGFRVFSVITTVVTSLLLARYIQAMLFYPQGFRKEMLAFRVNSGVIFIALLAAVGIYQDYSFAVGALPVLVVYFMLGGISLAAYYLLQKKDNLKAILILVIPLIVLPYLTVPFYAALGAIDSLLNIRKYLRNTFEKTKN